MLVPTAEDVARAATRAYQADVGSPDSVAVGPFVPVPQTPSSPAMPSESAATSSSALPFATSLPFVPEAGALPPTRPAESIASAPPLEPPGLESLRSAARSIAAHFGAAPPPFDAPVPADGLPAESAPLGVRATEAPSYDLRAFVRRVRESSFRDEAGLCGGDPLRRALRRGTGPDRPPHPGGPSPLDVPTVRRDFPALHQSVHGRPLVWFDNAATTHKPQAVIDALSTFYARDNSNIHRAAHALAARATDAYEAARRKVQHFLGAGRPEEIVFVRGTTEGINLVAQSWGRRFLQPGDEILLTVLEHHANIVPWQMIAQQTGAEIRVAPVGERGEILVERFESLLGPRTRLVALAHANNSLGTLLPVTELTQMARRRGARVLIDGAQSVAHVPVDVRQLDCDVAHVPVDVRQLDCDFFVFSGHKIFGPTGIGAVYARHELLEAMPPWQGGGSMIRDVTFEETKYSDPPAKFEAGTPNIADAVGLGTALDYVSRLGRPAIAAHEHALLEHATAELVRIPGLRIVGTAPEKVGVLSFLLRDRPVEEVGRLLDLAGIAVRSGHHCAQPSLRRFGLEKTVRASFSLYNTHDEIDRFVETLRHVARR